MIISVAEAQNLQTGIYVAVAPLGKSEVLKGTITSVVEHNSNELRDRYITLASETIQIKSIVAVSFDPPNVP